MEIPAYLLTLALLGQTAGQVVDTELTAIRAELDDIRVELSDLNPDDIAAIAALTARLGALEIQVNELGSGGGDSPCPKCNDVTITNIEKMDAWQYLRIAALEIDLDPSGDITHCWDTGGIADLEGAQCICPPESTWRDASGDVASGCYLEEVPSQVPGPVALQP